MPGYELMGEDEKQAVCEVFDKGAVLYRYALNDKRQNIFRVEDFERKVSEKFSSKHVLCVCNGTAAVKLGLIALGVKPGDEVITQSFTFIATVEAILELGAIPVIAEVDESLNMDPVDLGEKITKKTKAIIPVHMAGVSARMDEITNISRKYGIPIMEDSCQAMGATYNGKYLGTIGDAGAFSLDLGKIITTGEGGLLLSRSQIVYQKAREYSDHGHQCNPAVPRGEDTRTTWGFNYKATELIGAIGSIQLGKIDYILDRQRNNKKVIKDGIANTLGLKFRYLPDEKGDAGDTLIFFVDNHKKASKFAKLLASSGIGTKNLPDAIDWHFSATWKHIFYSYPEYNGKDLEKVWGQSSSYLRRAVALPIMVNMDQKRIYSIIAKIKEIAKELE